MSRTNCVNCGAAKDKVHWIFGGRKVKREIAYIIDGMEAMRNQFESRAERAMILARGSCKTGEEEVYLRCIVNIMNYWIDEIKERIYGIKKEKNENGDRKEAL